MMMANVDWNSDGFAEGSNTVDDDWKLWKRPIITLRLHMFCSREVMTSYVTGQCEIVPEKNLSKDVR
jgi:hypothetical protein